MKQQKPYSQQLREKLGKLEISRTIPDKPKKIDIKKLMKLADEVRKTFTDEELLYGRTFR